MSGQFSANKLANMTVHNVDLSARYEGWQDYLLGRCVDRQNFCQVESVRPICRHISQCKSDKQIGQCEQCLTLKYWSFLKCCCYCMQPMRVLITGPPACGKTTVIEQLCAHFKLHHVKIKDVIDDAISQMVNDFRCYCVLYIQLFNFNSYDSGVINSVLLKLWCEGEWSTRSKGPEDGN